MSFKDLGLSAPILLAIEEKGYTKPSPIQAQAIPAVLDGDDLMAAAQTGTGKTAGFTLPILEILSKGQRVQGNQARCLILTPTRELAAQIEENVKAYSTHLPIRSAVIFGGVNIRPQIAQLKKGVDILIATPGRLLDLYNQGAIRFKHLEVLVLDEADRMLDMGFIRDIKKILTFLPPKRQNLLFSATFSDDIRKLAKGLVNNPVEISVTPRNAAAKTVEQTVYEVDKQQKTNLLIQLVNDHNWQQVLVFTKTKHGANRLAKKLEAQKITSAAIHGNKSQAARTKALANFKDGSVRVLVATDIAARGIDIDQLPQVVNFDLPNVPEDYVHRIGRTGRAGATGKAVSLVAADDMKLLKAIERLIKKPLERLDLPEFKTHVAPAKNPADRDLRSTKAFKPKGERGSSARNSKKPQNKGGAKSRNRAERERGETRSKSEEGVNTNNSPSKKASFKSRKPRRIDEGAKSEKVNAHIWGRS